MSDVAKTPGVGGQTRQTAASAIAGETVVGALLASTIV
jgi:hypothetical protein